MARRDERERLFNRRTALVAGGQLGLFGILLGRLYFLQVVEADKYQILAEENRINVRLLAPRRGRIFDRFGVELAGNVKNYRMVLVPEQTRDIAQTLQRLAQHLPLGEAAQLRIMEVARKRRAFVPITIVDNLTWEEFAHFNVLLPSLPGVQPDVGVRRHYALGAAMAHLSGYVSAVAERNLTGDPLLELPGFRVGRTGLERTFEKRLRGKAGYSRVEVNAYGRTIRELAWTPGETGGDVQTTLDGELQAHVFRRLNEDSAAAAVMDVDSGEVLALASTPSFDPSVFDRGLSAKSWRALSTHPRAPLTNKAVAGRYPPGSTFKMVVALAALEAGVITPQTRFYCNGALELGDSKFHCWRGKYGGHGHVVLHKAIEQSCDVYFYELALRLGVNRIAAMARRFGYGQAFDIGLSGVSAGLVPDKDWKRAVLGKSWTAGETLITGIGQGYLLATPLQLCIMTARLVNGGFAVLPRLVRDDDARAPAPAAMGVSPSALKLVLDGMNAVVNGSRGTARKARLDASLGTMGGKTGTSQVRRISKRERLKGIAKNKDKAWAERDHALFVGYAPAAAPRYAVSVVVEHGGGGTYAGLITRDIMAEVLKRDPARRLSTSGPPKAAEEQG